MKGQVEIGKENYETGRIYEKIGKDYLKYRNS